MYIAYMSTKLFNLTISLLLYSIWMLPAATLAQQITYVPEKVSKLWIEGRSNISEFECQANQYFAEATIFDDSQREIEFLQNVDERVFLQVEIRVDGFECGKSRMNRDLQEALKSAEFPEITFLFDSATLLDTPPNEDEAFEIEVLGSLTVAGNRRDIQFVTRAYFLQEHRVRAIGKTTIRMSDFNVDPPTALMGLIKAEDELSVNFDLIAIETDQICQVCPFSGL
ncbi:MAG: YceI family protein [Balneolaceae bacterium]|nr:MAG: YceI family protein [Balneolaceae bacterium]